MKTINSLILSLATLFVLGACEEDGDKYYLSSLTSNELIASTDNIVLTEATAQKNVLSLAWTDRTLAISNPNFKPTNLLKTAMQVSLSEDFSGTIVESAETSLSKTYNGAELNIVANNLGVEANVATKFYFRLKGTTGNNIDPAYSNVEAVTITPYELDMRFANVLDQNATATGMTLFSANTDGIYKGFVGVEGWFNFLVQEADGTIWRNDNETGMPFLLTTAGDWKCWFPGTAGCYYITFDTNSKQWNGLLIPSLNVSGDINATMTFDRTSRKWTATFNADATGTITVRIDGTGKLYDHTCANLNDNGGYDIDDTKAKDTPVAFSGSNAALSFGETAGDGHPHLPRRPRHRHARRPRYDCVLLPRQKARNLICPPSVLREQAAIFIFERKNFCSLPTFRPLPVLSWQNHRCQAKGGESCWIRSATGRRSGRRVCCGGHAERLARRRRRRISRSPCCWNGCGRVGRRKNAAFASRNRSTCSGESRGSSGASRCDRGRITAASRCRRSCPPGKRRRNPPNGRMSSAVRTHSSAGKSCA